MEAKACTSENVSVDHDGLSSHALRLIFTITGANAIFLSIAYALELSRRGTHIFSGDLYADFLKVVLSYPGAAHAAAKPGWGLDWLISGYLHEQVYQSTLQALENGSLTLFHLPPLTTSFCLGVLQAMQSIGIQPAFYVLYLLLFYCFWRISRQTGRGANRRVFGLVLLSYPFLFMLQRGNLFAGATSLLIIQSLLLVQRRAKLDFAAILLAIAVNIRPNALIFAIALILIPDGRAFRRLGIFLLSSGTIFFSTLLLAHSMYPDYSLMTFRKGVETYHRMYVAGGGGLAYSSSFHSLLQALRFPLNWHRELVATLATLGILLHAWRSRVFNNSGIAIPSFILCSIYVLGSSVFADYHLLVFLGPLMLMIIEQDDRLPALKPGSARMSAHYAFMACCLMLSPKNFIFSGDVPLLTLLNPLILAYSSFRIIEATRRGT
jgi:hypothetical protein